MYNSEAKYSPKYLSVLSAYPLECFQSKFDPFNEIFNFRKIVEPNDSKINRAVDTSALPKTLCKKAHCHDVKFTCTAKELVVFN